MDTGSLVTLAFRKQTHTDRVWNFDSSHSNNAKATVVRALVSRIETHFAEGDMEGQQSVHVHEILGANEPAHAKRDLMAFLAIFRLNNYLM